jgi:tRNA-dihydrouridine synthase
MNCNGYMIQPDKLVKHLIHHDQEEKLIAQIYGGNRETLLQTAIDVEKKYPHFMGIELNIGCPSPKVMACG